MIVGMNSRNEQPCVGVQGGADIWTHDVLNVGVRPDILIPLVAQRFEAAGGTIMECTVAAGIAVHANGVSVATEGEGEAPLTARLLIDAMGNGSPIVRQLR
jgi:lycopene cyclase CruP